MKTTGSNPIADRLSFPSEALRELDVSVVSSYQIESNFLERCLALPELEEKVLSELSRIDDSDPDSVMLAAFAIRTAILDSVLPESLIGPLLLAYQALSKEADLPEALVTVRPLGSSAHQGGRYRGLPMVTKAILTALAEQSTRAVVEGEARQISEICQNVPVLRVARAMSWDCSGTANSYESRSGSRDFVVVYSTWGLAEDIARKELARDEYTWHKPTLGVEFRPLVRRRVGNKEFRLDFDISAGRMRHGEVPHDRVREFSLTAEESYRIARAAQLIELEVGHPVEIDWGMEEGWSRSLHLLDYRAASPPPPRKLKLYTVASHGETVVQGKAVGTGVAVGRVRVIDERSQLKDFQPGEILVTRKTEPDWEPYFRQAGAIVTEQDTRVSHSTILARELGIPAIMEASGATLFLDTGQMVTVSCCQGDVACVYQGKAAVDVQEYDASSQPDLKSKLMINLSMPERALAESRQPWAGAGLVRSEFIFSGWIRIHPMALLQPQKLAPEVQGTLNRLCRGYESKREYFLDQMSQAVSTVASAFWPRPVILRLSDLKSHEYAKLVGGERFEPSEANPALGFRGAARYLHPDYRPAFEMELEAANRVRHRMGLKNLHLMIPFCRTPGEAEDVLSCLESAGLARGEDGLQVWMMAELPSHVILAEEFAELFDGFSIGSNDLTQTILAVDRDNKRVAHTFDEIHPALMVCYQKLIKAAHSAGKPIGFCGQIAADDPLFVEALVEMGIDSVSVPPDAFTKTLASLLFR